MTTASESQTTPREIARILFRHWKKTLAFVVGAAALTVLVIATYPRSYSSEAKLFIRVGRESVGLDPTATTGDTIMLQKTQMDEVNSALNILSSREVFQRVVERIGAARILADVPSKEADSDGEAATIGNIGEAVASIRSWIGGAMQAVGLSDPGTDVDRAIRRLDSKVYAWAPKQSTVITVSYTAASPELAHDVVEATANIFLEEHLRLSQTEGSLAFFSEQADKLHNELISAQSELRDRKNAFQVASSDSRRSILEEQISSVESERLKTKRELAYAQAKIADLERAIAGLKPELITSRVAGLGNQAKDSMRAKLYDLELQENELSSRFTEEHPLLKQVRRQRDEAQAILAKVPDDRTQTTAALNTNQRKLELELMEAKADAEALQAQQAAGQMQRDKVYAELQTLNDQELQLSQLERNVDLLEGKYRMHVDKLEQARVNDALGRERISNVKIAQPATLVHKPVSPNKQLLLGLGLMVALVGGIGSAFVSESLDQTLRTTDQVEAQLGLPVLLSLPHRKRRSRNGAAAAAAAARNANGQSGHNGHDKLGNYRSLVRELLSSGTNGSNGHNGHRHARTIGVVGCDSSKLRSRVAGNLALEAASSGSDPVLLIDADSRRRRVAKRFHINDSPGWHEVLAGVADAESCIQRPEVQNLAVMAAGGSNGNGNGHSNGNGNGATAKSTAGIVEQLDGIKSDYGLVVVDLPPAREMDSPPPAAEWLDEMVLVVEAERTRIHAAKRAKHTLERAGVHLAGVVLANRREHIPRWLYQRL